MSTQLSFPKRLFKVYMPESLQWSLMSKCSVDFAGFCLDILYTTSGPLTLLLLSLRYSIQSFYHS
jgi:hypothetical protein